MCRRCVAAHTGTGLDDQQVNTGSLVGPARLTGKGYPNQPISQCKLCESVEAWPHRGGLTVSSHTSVDKAFNYSCTNPMVGLSGSTLLKWKPSVETAIDHIAKV